MVVDLRISINSRRCLFYVNHFTNKKYVMRCLFYVNHFTNKKYVMIFDIKY